MSQPMNREQRRMLKKQGQEVNEAGEVVATKRTPAKAKAGGSGDGGGGSKRVSKGEAGGDGGGGSGGRTPPPADERTSPLEFAREVRSEIRKVSWPTRAEVINYSLVVFFTVIALTTLIGLLDWLFSISILELFKP